MSSKPNLQTGQLVPFYSVVEHPELAAWVIKSGAIRVPKGQKLQGPMNDRNETASFTEEESLLRIEMANRIEKVAREMDFEVAIPRKKYVKYKDVTEPTKKYCVVSEKFDLLSFEESLKEFKSMSAEKQREIAQKICTLVRKTGLVDASFHNIRFMRREGRLMLSIVDTEPAGLMVAKKSGLCGMLVGPKGASVEKCGRIGLFTLLQQTSASACHPEAAPKVMMEQLQNLQDLQAGQACEPGLEPFRAVVKREYEEAISPRLSRWKIVLSVVSVGLLPLVLAIVALVKTLLMKRIFEKLKEISEPFFMKVFISGGAINLQEQEAFQKAKAPLEKQFYSSIEGVPYKNELMAALLGN